MCQHSATNHNHVSPDPFACNRFNEADVESLGLAEIQRLLRLEEDGYMSVLGLRTLPQLHHDDNPQPYGPPPGYDYEDEWHFKIRTGMWPVDYANELTIRAWADFNA